jgi:hypothetical protein
MIGGLFQIFAFVGRIFVQSSAADFFKSTLRARCTLNILMPRSGFIFEG